jgi:hypothetical protein
VLPRAGARFSLLRGSEFEQHAFATMAMRWQRVMSGNGGVCSQIRTRLAPDFPDKGRFTGNFRQKLPVPRICPWLLLN